MPARRTLLRPAGVAAAHERRIGSGHHRIARFRSFGALDAQPALSLLLIVGATSSAISGAVGVGLALSGFGVWALAWQGLSMSLTSTTLLWLVGGWRPKLTFNVEHVLSLLGFSGNLVINALLDVAYNQGFSLIIGKLHSIDQLGFYNRASGVQALPSTSLSAIISRVALPIFSARAHDLEAIRRGVGIALRGAMAINVPIMIGLGVLSDIVISVLFGEKWLPAAPILSILCISGLLWPIHVINLQVLLARGDSNTFLRMTVKKHIVGIVAIVVGSFFGIAGLAWSQIVFGAIAAVINTAPSGRALGHGLTAQTRDISGIMVAGMLMGFVLMNARSLIILSPIAELFVMVSLGGAVYFGIALVFRMTFLMEAWEILTNVVKSRAARVALTMD
ncbi:oligosaccharide flippase family protein [Methylocystis sp. IM4]|uniref:oligosaccharide flippase family protein n=1 Tax=Methylocystis sp. IM4 TaxID=3136560 RepID=UPI00311A82E0